MAVDRLSSPELVKLLYVVDTVYDTVFEWKLESGAYRFEWSNGATVSFSYYNNSSTLIQSGDQTSGTVDFVINSAKNIYVKSSITNTSIYVYKLAINVPFGEIDGELVTITTSGTYNHSGLAGIYLVGGGNAGGSFPTTTGGIEGALKKVSLTQLPSSPYTVTIGAGGAAPAGLGGTTSIPLNPTWQAVPSPSASAEWSSNPNGSKFFSVHPVLAPQITPSFGPSYNTGKGGNSAFGANASEVFSPGNFQAATPGIGSGMGTGGDGGNAATFNFVPNPGQFNQPYTVVASVNAGGSATGYGAGGGAGTPGGAGAPGVVYIVKIQEQ